MAGTFLDYKPGRIDARFSHAAEFDYIQMRIRMRGATTSATECDDSGRLSAPVHYRARGVDFSVYMSSVFCPFRDFISFLEAIACEVQECAFEWDPEGPTGRMSWRRRYFNDTGFLTVEWHSHRQEFSHRMMLNTRQAVRMLYMAFRRFVESPQYDPIRYEKLSAEEAFSLVISDSTTTQLANTLVNLDAQKAGALISVICDAIHKRTLGGAQLDFSLQHYIQISKDCPTEANDIPGWISPEWDSWDRDRRLDDVRNGIFKGGPPDWYGANLRDLRSRLVEDWLALPEPSPRPSYPIPQNADAGAL